MFKNGADYDVDLQKLAASDTLKKLNNLPREQKVWLDNLKGRYAGEKNPMYGKTHTEEARTKISNAHMGRKHNPIVDEQRKKTMLKKYGKKSLSKPTHTFAGVSLWDFMNNNRDTIISLVDDTHRYKYHKIHKYIMNNLTSDTTPTQSYRSVAITKWFKTFVEETA